MIYIVKAWRYVDGITKVFCFSSQSKRDDFLADLREDVNNVLIWEYGWELEDLELDPKVPVSG